MPELDFVELRCDQFQPERVKAKEDEQGREIEFEFYWISFSYLRK